MAVNHPFRLSLLVLSIVLFSNLQALSHKSAVAPIGAEGAARKLLRIDHQALSVGSIQSGIFQFGSADVRHFVVTAEVPLNETVSSHRSDRPDANKSAPQLYGYVIETNKHAGALEVIEEVHHRKQKLHLTIDSSGSACRVWPIKREKNQERKVVHLTVNGKRITLSWTFVSPPKTAGRLPDFLI